MFEYNGCKISARELTIADDDAITGFFDPISSSHPTASVLSVIRFGEFMLGAVIDGDPPLPMVTPQTPASEIGEAYRAWLALPRRFAVNWRKEVNSEDNPAPKK